MQNFVAQTQDPRGFVVYQPVNQLDAPQQTPYQYTKETLAPAKTNKTGKNSNSWFSKFFEVQDGVISLSLKDQTLILSIGISIALIIMCFVSCKEGEFECSLHDFPMVSDVLALHMYDRTFIILTTIMMFGVQQVNIRAFYKKLYGKVSDCYNDFLMVLGILSCITLPLIGVFDEHEFNPIHCTCAGIFFGCFGFYCILLGRALYQNRDKFPQDEQKSIDLMMKNTWGLLIVLVAFLISIKLYTSRVPTPLIEWATVLYFVNFFSIASFTNAYYDSVHEDGTLIPRVHE
eukprot:403334206